MWTGPTLANERVAKGMSATALDYLARKGPCFARDLAAAKGWRLSTTKQVLGTLARDGLIEWGGDEASLTDAGLEQAMNVREAEARRRNQAWREIR